MLQKPIARRCDDKEGEIEKNWRMLIATRMSEPIGLDIKLDAVSRQFKPCFTAGCVCTMVAPLWSGLGSCSRGYGVDFFSLFNLTSVPGQNGFRLNFYLVTTTECSH